MERGETRYKKNSTPDTMTMMHARGWRQGSCLRLTRFSYIFPHASSLLPPPPKKKKKRVVIFFLSYNTLGCCFQRGTLCTQRSLPQNRINSFILFFPFLLCKFYVKNRALLAYFILISFVPAENFSLLPKTTDLNYFNGPVVRIIWLE